MGFVGVVRSLQQTRTGKWVVIGVVALVLLIGGIFAAVAYDHYQDGEETKAWPATSGEILTAEVEEKQKRERRDNGTYRTRYTYTPRVTYAYTIQGVDYTGHRIRADDTGGDRDRAYDTINDFPVGALVDVYYNPADPGSSVLRQGADPLAVWMFGSVGGVLLTIGVIGLVGFVVLGRRA